MKKILILLVLLFSTSVSSLVWGAENYDDCILKNMKGIGSDVAAKAIIDACKVKHENRTFSICVETEAQIINGIIFPFLDVVGSVVDVFYHVVLRLHQHSIYSHVLRFVAKTHVT